MTHNFTLVLGGARSGKSTFAQSMAQETGKPVVFVATAEAFDQEMADRIAVHRAERPQGWRTIEAPRQVGQALIGNILPDGVVLLDCLTLLASNVLLALTDVEDAGAVQTALDAEIDSLLAAHQSGQADWIVVSNEVGLGLVPEYPLGRIYRDALGRANQRLARYANRVIFMVAGLPMVVK